MRRPAIRTTGSRTLAVSLGAVLVVLLVLPMVSLALAASPADVRLGLESPLFLPALALSVRTTLLSLGIIVLTGDAA